MPTAQDNATGWIDWKGLKKNEKLLEFVKEAIAFRKDHPVLHTAGEMRGVDYQTKGLPGCFCTRGACMVS